MKIILQLRTLPTTVKGGIETAKKKTTLQEYEGKEPHTEAQEVQMSEE